MKLLVDSCVFIDAFDPQSLNHAESLALMEDLQRREILITMPAHGWFEIQCNLQRLSMEKRFVGPNINGNRNYQMKLIHIDALFIQKYSMANIPYIKAGDHIFLAVAKVGGYQLVTSDLELRKASRQCGVQVFSPSEFSDRLAKGT